MTVAELMAKLDAVGDKQKSVSAFCYAEGWTSRLEVKEYADTVEIDIKEDE